MRNLGKFYIDGQWVKPLQQKSFSVLNPATEEQIGSIGLGSKADVDLAVAAAQSAFQYYGHSAKQERLEYLRNLLKISKTRFEDMAQAMRMEMGAPITMARDYQADTALGHLQEFIDALEAQPEKQTLKNGDLLWREPIGVCGLITPWNWPINQIVLKVIPALAAGCCCILKPSEYTPISAMVYAEIIDSAGFPKGVFNLIQGTGPEVGAALSRHQDVQMMSFTGSTRAGIAVTKDSADTVKRVTLELGGKSPNLVFADCQLEECVTASVSECMLNTGQSCDAPTRLLVERSCYDQVKELVTKAAFAITVDAPSKEGPHIGPLFDEIQFNRVQSLIQAGIDEGANLLCGGIGRPKGFDKGWFVRPTIFADVRPEMRIAREEIFGPVLVIIPFDDEDHALEIANDTTYGLAAYIQTGNKERALRVAAKLRAGAIHVNGGAMQYGSPFGGYKESGNGREGGIWGLEEYQEIKTLHFG